MKTIPAPKPLTPASTLPWTPCEWTPAQQTKLAELTDKCVARARKPYLKPIAQMKTALELGRLELAASHKLLAVLT